MARRGRPDDAAERGAVDAAVRPANAALGPQQRIAGWRVWPDDDFPRTHTLKVRRDPIRAWANGERRSHGRRLGAGATGQFGTVNPIPSVPSAAATLAAVRSVGRRTATT